MSETPIKLNALERVFELVGNLLEKSAASRSLFVAMVLWPMLALGHYVWSGLRPRPT